MSRDKRSSAGASSTDEPPLWSTRVIFWRAASASICTVQQDARGLHSLTTTDREFISQFRASCRWNPAPSSICPSLR